MLNTPKFAVQFGKSVDKGFEGGVVAFPFLYTFVNPSNDTWDQVKNPASLQNNLIDVGPLIAANSNVQIVVTLDADHFFKLLDVRYTAYYMPPRTTRFSWHDETPGFFYDPVSCIPISETILRHIRVNLSVVHNGRYLYGNTNSYQQTAQILPVIPLNIDAIQGNEYGFGQVRTEYLLPANGALRFDVYNDNDFPVVVGATIRGMKVRL
jgi:hypothetical protein